MPQCIMEPLVDDHYDESFCVSRFSAEQACQKLCQTGRTARDGRTFAKKVSHMHFR